MIKKLLKINNYLPMTSFVCVFLLLLVACSKGQTPVSSPVRSQPAKAAAVQVKPIQKAVSSALRLPVSAVNQFDFSNKKDPFKPFIAAKNDTKNPTETEIFKKNMHNSLPIHSYDVNQFKLIGIITGGKESQAMVTDPGGKGYVLKVGMTMGKNDGRIISINTNGVEVLEQFKDDNGKVRKENIKLTIPRKQ
jgi:type IV pilus assembly protein PilP